MKEAEVKKEKVYETVIQKLREVKFDNVLKLKVVQEVEYVPAQGVSILASNLNQKSNVLNQKIQLVGQIRNQVLNFQAASQDLIDNAERVTELEEHYPAMMKKIPGKTIVSPYFKSGIGKIEFKKMIKATKLAISKAEKGLAKEVEALKKAVSEI